MPVKRHTLPVALALACSAIATTATAGPAGNRATVFEKDWRSAPSAKYGALSAAACRSELKKRKIAFTPVADAPGVLAPVRIPEGVGGVAFHTLVLEKDRPTPWEIFDCRLVLALHDLSAILRDHHVDDVVIFSAWRPPPPKWPEGKLAKRHPGALAVDVMRMRWTPPPESDEDEGDDEQGKAKQGKAKQGKASKPEPIWIDVRKDFHGRIGDKTCGSGARGPRAKTEPAKILRAIVCEAADARIFTSMLTPNYDRHHHDHLHLEVTPKVKWRMVR